MIDEIMGHKTGWLTLHAGIAGNADVILIPEIPYDIKEVRKAIDKKMKAGKDYIVIAAAEGIISKEDAKLPKKELKAKRAEDGFISAGYRLAAELAPHYTNEVRVVVPGHVQRGGNPDAFDRAQASFCKMVKAWKQAFVIETTDGVSLQDFRFYNAWDENKD